VSTAKTTTSTKGAPNLYDLLDVEPDASSADIRAAWRRAIDGLEPGDRRFRAFNAAAETLLDDERRAAYDAELAAAALPGVEEAEETSLGSRDVADAPPRPTETSTSVGRPVAGWVLVVLALVTAAAVTAAAWLWWGVPSDASVAASTREAQAAAERAIVPVLSYDAATLDQDQAEGAAYLTASYRKDYDQLYEVIKQNAPRVGTVVEAEVVSSGVVRASADNPERVEVLIFVNRPTTNKKTEEPVVYRDQVTVTMQRVGGEWLVDGLKTSPAEG
jgi:Mce-associated membrane protein